MYHHVTYWKMSKREVDVTDARLAELQAEEDRGEIYIELLDGHRLPLTWDHESSHWLTTRARTQPAAA